MKFSKKWDPDELIEILKEKGLQVEKKWDPDEMEFYLDVFDNGFKIGQFEYGEYKDGNNGWELVCYSIEGEQKAKQLGLMDFVDQYWAWY